MQMKMEKKRPKNLDKNKLRKILENEDEFISTLFDCFEVPESKEGIQLIQTLFAFIFEIVFWICLISFFRHWFWRSISIEIKSQGRQIETKSSCKGWEVIGWYWATFRNHTKQNEE